MTMMAMEGATAAEVLAGGRVNAAVANAHLQWVRDYHGDTAVEGVFAILPRDLIESARGDGWISFEALVALDRAIERRCGRGRAGFLRELGRYSAHLNLALAGFRGEAMHDFFHRASRLHDHFQDFGSAVYEELDLTRGRMVHTSDRCFSLVYCASAAGYYEQALVAHYAVPRRIEEVTCQCRGDASCTFELEWA